MDASATLDRTVDRVTRIATQIAQKIGDGRPLHDDEMTDAPGCERPAYGVPDRTRRRHPPFRPDLGHAHRP